MDEPEALPWALDGAAGDGGMAARLRAHDWSASPLGPPAGWSPALRTTAGLMLGAGAQIVLFWGPEFTALYNDAFAPAIGARHPGAWGRPARENWAEFWDELGPLLEGVRRTGRTVTARDRPFRLERHGYPETAYFDISASAVPEADGSVGGVLCIVSETTDRVLAERRLAEGEERLRLAAEAARIGTWDFDLATGTGRWDAAAVRIVGAEPDRSSYDAETWQLIVHPDDRARVAAAFEASLAPGGPPYDVEFRAARPAADGSSRWITSHGAVLRDPARGTAHRAVGIVRDVTERRHREDRIEASEAQLRLGLAAARMVAWTYDLGTGHITRTENADAIFGPGSLAEDFAARMPEDDRAADSARFRAALADPAARYESEFRYRHPDGRLLWLHNQGQVVRDAAGSPVCVHGVCLDVTARKEAELALQRSEEDLRNTLELNPQVPWTCDPDGRITSYTSRWLELTGQAPGEPLGDGWTRVVHPDDLPGTLRAFAASLASGDPIDVEYRIRTRSGEYRWARARANPLRDAAGRIVRWYGLVEDNHDRKLAELRLRELNETLETEVAARTAERDHIWRLSPDLMCVARADGTLLSVNPAWERILGWPSAWLEGRNATELWHPDGAGRSAAELRRLAGGGQSRAFEDRYRHRDGSFRWISWTVQPEGGLVYGIGRDVTAERETRAALAAAERARQEADALYRAYFENSPEALFVIGVEADGGFVVEQINPAHEASVGFALEAVRGRRIGDILPPAPAARVLEAYRHVVAQGRIHQYREIFELDSEARHWDTSLVPLRDAEGRIVRLIGSSRDVTRQVRAEEALRQAQKMEAVGRLTGGIAHDFNNLLGAVLGGFDLIRRRPDDPDRVRRIAENGLAAAERGAKLTGQLLAFSRAQRIEQKPLAVAELVEGMRPLLAQTLGPQVRLEFELGACRPVLSDPIQLEMAVLNLAINARDAMPGGGTLTIRTAARRLQGDPELPDGGYVELSVGDTGAGMPPDVAARAFDPFFTTKEVGKGTGLGLSQVYGIARQGGGSARIESRVGHGTTVRLILPETDAPLPACQDEAGTAEPAGPAAATVLVIDDDGDLRRMLVESLDALGYRTLEAADGPAGLAALAGNAPDLVLLDFAMPGMNGAEVAAAIRAERPSLPIVFASGHAETAAIERVAGPDAWILRKPFRVDELQAVLAERLGRRE